jgi:hypothetical protein
VTVRAQRRALWTLSAALAVATAHAAALLLQPVRLEAPAAAVASQPAPANAKAAPTIRPLAEHVAAAGRDLRRPLEDPKPMAASAPAAPKLTVELMGTVIETNSAQALLRTSAGQSKFASVGDTVEGITVKAVEANQATVEFAGQLVTLTVRREEGR